MKITEYISLFITAIIILLIPGKYIILVGIAGGIFFISLVIWRLVDSLINKIFPDEQEEDDEVEPER